jgi:hypothetical protein
MFAQYIIQPLRGWGDPFDITPNFIRGYSYSILSGLWALLRRFDPPSLYADASLFLVP